MTIGYNCPVGRDLAWDGCLNVRDLGGLPTVSGGTIRWRRVVRADSLSRLSRCGWEECRDYGIRTVIDLRTSEERALQPSRTPPWPEHQILHAPIFDEDDEAWMERMVESIPTINEHYEHILRRCVHAFAGAVSSIAVAREGGVVVHCSAGRDRTGLLIAMVLELVGVPRDVIAEDYSITAQRIPDGNLCQPKTMLRALDLLDAEFGGVEQYLRTGGFEKHHLVAIRERLL